tara:strand:- start:619 stop:798 length:180 start_codon:yes stop_codon:yes gene_type:complete
MVTTLTAVLTNLCKSVVTEYVFKRLIYLGLKSLADSTENKLDDKAVAIVGQALGLEEKT